MVVGGARRCGLQLVDEVVEDGRAKDILSSEEQILAQLQEAWSVCLIYQLHKDTSTVIRVT